MSNITKCIKLLNEENSNSYECTVYNYPSTEAEYQADVKYISGSDSNGLAIYMDTQPYTWEQIQSKLATAEQEIADEITARNNVKVSGNQKLLDLGLTQAEATALTGYTPPVAE